MTVMKNYFVQAWAAAEWMDRERARHPASCIIWLTGDGCDCGTIPKGEDMNDGFDNERTDREMFERFRRRHPSGLIGLTDEDLEFLAVPPGRSAVFETSGEDVGDLVLDMRNFGWYDRSDAEEIAAYFGLPLTERTVAGPVGPRNPRRKS